MGADEARAAVKLGNFTALNFSLSNKARVSEEDAKRKIDPTLPPGTNASRLEVVSDSGELKLERLGRSMPDNPKTGVLTALTMADDLMKMVRASDW